MIRSPLVVVVDADADELLRTEQALEAIGFVVMGVDSFPGAKTLLGSVSPEIVVADVKLNAFNGLHLAALSIAKRPGTPFIVTHNVRDVVLEGEAQRLGAMYVVKTPSREELKRAATEAVNAPAHQGDMVRQWPRKGAPRGTVARVAAAPATVVDVSYGGVRLKIGPDSEHEPPQSFEVVLPALDLALHVDRAWAAKDSGGEGGWICGASIADERTTELLRWRDFVDSVG